MKITNILASVLACSATAERTSRLKRSTTFKSHLVSEFIEGCNGQVPDIYEYGCWCPILNGGSAFRGKPLDSLDRLCQSLSKCLHCAQDLDDCGTTFLATTYGTNCGDVTCDAGNNKCQLANCNCHQTFGASLETLLQDNTALPNSVFKTIDETKCVRPSVVGQIEACPTATVYETCDATFDDIVVGNPGSSSWFNKHGSNYRGCQTTTKSGRTCQAWTESDGITPNNIPHVPLKTPTTHPNGGLGYHNYCRNPHNLSGGTWCYTTDVNKRWEYCVDNSIVQCVPQCGSLSYIHHPDGNFAGRWTDAYDRAIAAGKRLPTRQEWLDNFAGLALTTLDINSNEYAAVLVDANRANALNNRDWIEVGNGSGNRGDSQCTSGCPSWGDTTSTQHNGWYKTWEFYFDIKSGTSNGCGGTC